MNTNITDVWIYQTAYTFYYDDYGNPGAYGGFRLVADASWNKRKVTYHTGAYMDTLLWTECFGQTGNIPKNLVIQKI
jgi:hypothetical protein